MFPIWNNMCCFILRSNFNQGFVLKYDFQLGQGQGFIIPEGQTMVQG